MSNSNKASREPYYFTGSTPYNYVSHGGKSYRILYVDTDDSLVIVGDNLEGVFSSNQMQYAESGLGSKGTFYCDINTGKVKYTGSESGKKVNGVTFISAKDLILSKECFVNSFNIDSSEVKNCSRYQSQGCDVVGSATSGGTSVTYLSWLALKGGPSTSSSSRKYSYINYKDTNNSIKGAYVATESGTTYEFVDLSKWSVCSTDYENVRYGRNTVSCDDPSLYKDTLYQKVHLKSCVKIDGGVGSFENPYTLKSSC